MHFPGFNLHFKGFPSLTQQGSMQGLIHIRLGGGNIVLKSSGKGFPHSMDYTQNPITFSDFTDYDTNSYFIIYLVYILLLFNHFFINTIDILGSPCYIGSNTYLIQAFLYLLYNVMNVFFPLFTFFLKPFGNFIIHFRV